ncbi:Facilitated trehalose transporter Tret1 [Chamberlinius hualienensis]
MKTSFNAILLGIGRALQGFSIGMIVSGATVYYSEVSPKQFRGKFTSFYGCFVGIGGLYINAVGVIADWRWMIVAGLAINVLTAMTSFCMMETPRWLISKGHREAAAEVIEKLWAITDTDAINKEIKDIETNIKSTPILTLRKGLIELVKPPLWKPFLISQLLIAFQPFTGNSYITNYTTQIFEKIMLGKTTDVIFSNPKYQILFITLGYPVSGFFSLIFVDRVGRKFLLVVSGMAMATGLSGIGAYYYLQTFDPAFAIGYLYWLPFVGLIMFVLGFSFGFGGVPFIVVSELFPIQVRGVANSMCAVTYSLCYFIVLKVFPTITIIPDYGIFWFFAGVSFVCVIFIIVCIPETKGLQLEEIQKFWSAPKQISHKHNDVIISRF